MLIIFSTVRKEGGSMTKEECIRSFRNFGRGKLLAGPGRFYAVVMDELLEVGEKSFSFNGRYMTRLDFESIVIYWSYAEVTEIMDCP